MAEFDLAEAIAVLERTPRVVRALLAGLPEPWITATEGPETWSPYDVVGHLIHGERTDWITRTRHILEGRSEAFTPFDRWAMFEESRGKTLDDLLDEFETLRAGNLAVLRSLDISAADHDRPGLHPELGPVTLGQLLATWTVHDLGHLAQIERVMAKRYAAAVGPWTEYLPVLTR